MTEFYAGQKVELVAQYGLLAPGLRGTVVALPEGKDLSYPPGAALCCGVDFEDGERHTVRVDMLRPLAEDAMARYEAKMRTFVGAPGIVGPTGSPPPQAFTTRMTGTPPPPPSAEWLQRHSPRANESMPAPGDAMRALVKETAQTWRPLAEAGVPLTPALVTAAFGTDVGVKALRALVARRLFDTDPRIIELVSKRMEAPERREVTRHKAWAHGRYPTSTQHALEQKVHDECVSRALAMFPFEDAKCVTTPDGHCIGDGCMHDLRKST